MRRSRRQLRAVMFLGLGAILSAIWLAAYFIDAFRDLELDTVDTRFEIRGDLDPPKDLVVVQIDDVTFQDLDQRWPFPRRVHGKAVTNIAADKPRAIVYDVQFTERTSFNDEFALLEAISKADGKVVLATTEVNKKGQTKILGGDAVLKEVGARPGNGVLLPDPGGVERRVPHSVDGLETLAVAGTEVATGKQVSPSDFDARDDTAWIDYYGPPGTIRSVSFSRVVNGKTPPGTFKDKLVVIGPSAPSLQDVHPTSTTGDDELMAGAEIQATALDTVRRGLPLQSAPRWLDALLIVLLGMVAPVASMRLSPLRSIAIALALAVAFVVAVQLAFNGGTILAFVYPLGALVLATVGTLAVHYVTTAFERERVRDLFARFVPENVVDDVLARTDHGLRIGGVQRDGTVMFTDLRGFTSFAEQLPPDRVIDVLNVYLSGMSDTILNHGGTLVAYMGDGIMAVFGAPIEQPDHADRALRAAREMLWERLPAFNEWIKSEELGEGFRMGIGLNSGSVMSGNVGSERRLEYTAIGDTTNTASRLEGMTKGTPHQLFVSDTTRSRLKDEAEDLVYVGELEVRGRTAKVKLWSLPDVAPDAADGEGAAADAESESAYDRT
jgi:adenylate cyclase